MVVLRWIDESGANSDGNCTARFIRLEMRLFGIKFLGFLWGILSVKVLFVLLMMEKF